MTLYAQDFTEPEIRRQLLAETLSEHGCDIADMSLEVLDDIWVQAMEVIADVGYRDAAGRLVYDEGAVLSAVGLAASNQLSGYR